MSMPLTFDKSGVLIEKLGDDEDFSLSNVYLPSKKGVIAIHDIENLESEFLDIAHNPQIAKDQLRSAKPKPPDPAKYPDGDELAEAEEDYRRQLKEYKLMLSALDMQVSPADMFAIKQCMKKFWKAVQMTSAIKGRRFGAFTKYPNEESKKGLFGGGSKE